MSDQHPYTGLATKAIHAGYRPDPATGAVNAPIYASSTFAQDGVGGLRGGFEYARTGNPTRAALEASLAAVEEGAFARAFGSGMAATDCALRAMLRPGDHVVIPNDAIVPDGPADVLIDELDGVQGRVRKVTEVGGPGHRRDQKHHRQKRSDRCAHARSSAFRPALGTLATGPPLNRTGGSERCSRRPRRHP